MSAPAESSKDDLLIHLPKDAREALALHCEASAIECVSQFDLDEQGHYVSRWLVLTESSLIVLHRMDARWQTEIVTLSSLQSVDRFEGLGLHILRGMVDDRIVVEYRYTLRYAKEMAALSRRLEYFLTGTESDVPDTKAHPRGAGDAPSRPGRGGRGGPPGARGGEKLRCEKCGRVIPAWTEVCPTCMSRRKVLVRLFDFVKPYKWSAFGGLMMALLVLGGSLIQPYLTKPMLDQGLGASKKYDADYATLIYYLCFYLGLQLLVMVGNAVRMRLMTIMGSRIARDIRNDAYRHLHRLSLSFFAKKPTGSLITRITSDSDRIWDFVAFTMLDMLIAILTLVGVGVAMFMMNWQLACYTLIPVPIMVVLMILMHKRMHKFFRRIHHRWQRMTSVVSDAIPGVRVIKAFSQESREVDRFRRCNDDVYEGTTDMISTWTTFEPMLQFCSQIGTLIIWSVGGYWVVTGKFGPGTLMAFIAYMHMFYRPVHMISHMDRQLNRTATSVQRIFEILDTEPTIFSDAAAKTPDELKGKIELRNVAFSYDGVRKVLKNVNLTIEPGTMIGLAGPSGGGKTTLINLICRFYDTLEGDIFIDDVNVREYDLQALRRHIGVVLQEPFLFHGTIAANIAYGNPDMSRMDIIEAARAANAHDFVIGFPDGYDTMVGERGQTLSGGERQRISIARAVLSNPRILILDEATASVDTETEKLIQEALGPTHPKSNHHRDRTPIEHATKIRPLGDSGKGNQDRRRNPRGIGETGKRVVREVTYYAIGDAICYGALDTTHTRDDGRSGSGGSACGATRRVDGGGSVSSL